MWPIVAFEEKIYIYICIVNGPGDVSSITGRDIPKTQKMAHDATLLNTHHYKVWIKGKVEQSKKKISFHPYTLP